MECGHKPTSLYVCLYVLMHGRTQIKRSEYVFDTLDGHQFLPLVFVQRGMTKVE